MTDIEQKIRQALRWPPEMDTFALDGDQRGSIERVVPVVEELVAEEIKAILPEEKRFVDGDVKNASDYGWNACRSQIISNLKSRGINI